MSEPPAAAPGQPRTYSCRSCGASLVFSPREIALTCPYCDSSQVIEAAAGETRPDLVVPFAVDRAGAEAAFRRWLGRGLFRPGDFARVSRVDEIRGVYAPFWAFDATADSRWSASAGYDEPADPARPGGPRRTRFQPASGSHAADYHDLLVDAGTAIDGKLARTLAPFDLARAKAYDGAYLAGFSAELPSRDAAACWPEAEARVHGSEREACERLVPGDRHQDLEVASTVRRTAARLVLLPVWTFAVDYQGCRFRAAVNGVTGRAAGEAPWSRARVVVAIALVLALLGSLVLLMALRG